MNFDFRRFVLCALGLVFMLPCAAQKTSSSVAASAPTAVPPLVRYSGVVEGQSGSATATFLIFKDETGGEPLFTETQTVTLDVAGHYAVNLGATLGNGLPADLFATGEARWLEVQLAGQAPQSRVLLASVPYALKAGDAATLGGLPVTAFALAGTKSASTATLTPEASPAATDVTTVGGVSGYLAEFSGASTIVDSPVFVSGANVGIGTATPSQTLDVNGSAAFRGTASFFWNGGASPSKGANSNSLTFGAESYDSSTKGVIRPFFSLLAEAAGNNTASPSATLNLQYSNGTTLAETGFHFNANGTINFAAGQTFPATSAAGTAIDGTSTSGTGVVGTSGSGTGVEGTSSSGSGVYGVAKGASGINPSSLFGPAGLWGDSLGEIGVLGTSSTSFAVMGFSANFRGIYGLAGAQSGGSPGGLAGVWGDTSSGTGVFGSSSSSTGVYGQSLSGIGVTGSSRDAIGVSGSGSTGLAGSGGNVGVSGQGTQGVTGTGSAVGVYGVLSTPSTEGKTDGGNSGVWDDTATTGASALVATADEGYAGLFYNNSSTYRTLYALNDTTTSSTAFVFAANGSHLGGSCHIDVNGDLGCNGTVTDVVKVDSGARQVETYSVQSPENWFEDFGSARLVGGVARIDLDPAFAQTVNAGVEYHVFLTPNEDCKGLYASQKTATSFEVHELSGGTSSVAFDYRIVAKRAGYENVRLKDVTEQMRQAAEQEAAMRHSAMNEAHPAIPVSASPKIPAAGSTMHRFAAN